MSAVNASENWYANHVQAGASRVRSDIRVLICGNFSSGHAGMNGQTIKTRMLADALTSMLGESSVATLDTSSLFRHPIGFYSSARRLAAHATHVILLPGPRGVHVLLTLFLRWKKKHNTDLRYVVIGGFLPDYVKKHRRLRDACRRLDGIYVEAPGMASALRAIGFDNVELLPNFRVFDPDMSRSHAPTCHPIKLVFCARIIKEKGIEEAIHSVDRINAGDGAPVVTLDVYGPVTEPYRQHFTNLVAGSPGTTYKGVLATADIYHVLQQYDLMLFPTYYANEGFAGTIVDAFIAGVPVLASDWAYNGELVEHGRTGELCRACSVEDLTEKIQRYVRAPHLLAAMRQHCIDTARQYHADRALRGLLLDIGAEAGSASGIQALDTRVGH